MTYWFALQDALREGITAFVNGNGLTRTTALLYPYVDHVKPQFWSSWFTRINRLIAQISNNTSQLAPPFNSEVPLKDINTISIVLTRLAIWMQDTMPEELAQSNFTSIHCLKKYDLSAYQDGGEYLQPIIALQHFVAKNLKDLTVGVYLHGSMSTLDYVEGSSDVDALVVIKNEALQSPECLQKLRHTLLHSQRWFYRIDYSQHHGFSVLSELDLRFFSEAMFPRILFSYLTPLIGPDNLSIRPRHDLPDIKNGCLKTVEYICVQIQEPDYLKNWFSLKLFLQSILLLPTLFLQAKDVSVYKRDSFEIARPYFSDEAWVIIDKATRIRDLGVQKKLISERVDNLIVDLPNPWLASIVHRRFCNSVNDSVWEILSTGWLTKATQFVEEVKYKIIHD